jgi:thiamine kinase-like enzyme
MNYQYQTIPRADEKIKKTMKFFGLKPIDPNFTIKKSIKSEGRFYAPVCFDKKKKKVFFKARLQNTDEVLRTLKKEIEFHRSIAPLITKTKPAFLIPKIIQAKVKKDGYAWLLRDYFEGSFAGWMDIDFGVQKEFLKKISPKNFAQKIIAYQKITKRVVKKIKLNQHGHYWYKSDYNFYKNTETLKSFIPHELNEIGKIFEKNKKFLSNQAKTLAHGDLYPNNILLLPHNKIALIDWELIHLNNPAFDIAFTWMTAFRDAKWQKIFLQEILNLIPNKKTFKKLFRLACLSLSLRFIRACRIAATTFEKGYRKKLTGNGYSPTQIKQAKKNAREAQTAYVRILNLALHHPKKLI